MRLDGLTMGNKLLELYDMTEKLMMIHQCEGDQAERSKAVCGD